MINNIIIQQTIPNRASPLRGGAWGARRIRERWMGSLGAGTVPGVVEDAAAPIQEAELAEDKPEGWSREPGRRARHPVLRPLAG